MYGKLYSAPGNRYNGSPILLWEFGGVGYVRPQDLPSIPVNSWAYSGVEPSAEPALIRIRGLYEAIARIPQITGICYTQLYDVEQEINGLMTYDRRMKFDPATACGPFVTMFNDLFGTSVYFLIATLLNFTAS
jgi:hypothetical protein